MLWQDGWRRKAGLDGCMIPELARQGINHTAIIEAKAWSTSGLGSAIRTVPSDGA